MFSPIRRFAIAFACACALLSFFAGLAPAPAVVATPQDDSLGQFIRDHYVKHEYRIPMRDGVELHTAVYSPKDTSDAYPFMMIRTPYSCAPYGENEFPQSLGPSEHFAQDGFHFVYQDVRGAFMSGGEYLDMRPLETGSGPGYTDEATDTYDTIEWLLKNVAHNNGKVGMWGISYPGGYTSMGIVSRHPALVAASPQAPTTDWFIGDDFHRNGAFTILTGAEFYGAFGVPRPELRSEWPASMFEHGPVDLYDFILDIGSAQQIDEKIFKGRGKMWNDLIDHPNYDRYWKERNILPHLTDVKAAVLTVGGWLDAEDPYGPVETYHAIERANPGAENMLVMGPWYHSGWAFVATNHLGDIEFGALDTRLWFQEQVQFAFFRHHLKGGPKPDLPDALVYETGTNQWRRFDRWPPEDVSTRSLYLRENGGLAWQPSTATENVYDEYVSDPARPVPHKAEPVKTWSYEFMHADQRYAAKRPDVLVYLSEPLMEDVTLAGPVRADLMVSISGADADFFVKIIDVLPDDTDAISPENPDLPMGGYQQLVRWGVIRGRYRESIEMPKPFTPGEITRVPIRIDDLLHTFRKGHRIMIQVHSTWFPFFDRNPQTWVENIFKAKSADYQKATIRIHHDSAHPSRVEVGLLEN